MLSKNCPRVLKTTPKYSKFYYLVAQKGGFKVLVGLHRVAKFFASLREHCYSDIGVICLAQTAETGRPNK